MTRDYDCLKLENQLCFPLYACAKEVTRRYKPFLDRLDLTYTQYITMMVLWEEKRINVKEIGKRLYLDSGTLTPLLKKLEAKGYIRRQRSETDERNLVVTITEEGEALKEEARKVPEKMGQCLKFSDADTELAYTILYKMLDELKKDNEENEENEA